MQSCLRGFNEARLSVTSVFCLFLVVSYTVLPYRLTSTKYFILKVVI
jgi:hypothetical protein